MTVLGSAGTGSAIRSRYFQRGRPPARTKVQEGSRFAMLSKNSAIVRPKRFQVTPLVAVVRALRPASCSMEDAERN